jgi:hypothetical protein
MAQEYSDYPTPTAEMDSGFFGYEPHHQQQPVDRTEAYEMGAMNDPYYSRSAGRNGNYPSPRV